MIIIKFHKILLFFIFINILISPIFAVDAGNQFDDCLTVDGSDFIGESIPREVYFDSSVTHDGNGSQVNPYLTIYF